MRFLKLKMTHRRDDGSPMRSPIVVDAPRKYAPDSARTHKALCKRKCQLLMGAHDSGKTRWLSRIHNAHYEIYGKVATPVFLSGLQPILTWTDQPHVIEWHNHSDNVTPWKALNQHQRAERIADYLTETKAILYLDDAHKLTGRKCQIARQCLLSAKIWLMTTSDENRLPPNIRTLVESREPQRTRLQTEASYDNTVLFMWLLAAILAMAGAWEAATVLAGLTALGSGRRSARAD